MVEFTLAMERALVGIETREDLDRFLLVVLPVYDDFLKKEEENEL